MSFMTGEVEAASLEQVRSFLGLDLPKDRQQTEGARLEFKGPTPTGACDYAGVRKTVAAFANSGGGLLLVGAEEDRATNTCSGLPGVKRVGGGLKLALDSAIRAGVQPVPRFRIGIVSVSVEASDPRDIALVYVDEGDWPPYVYTEANAEQVVVVRSNNRSVPARLVELNALYDKRGSPGDESMLDDPNNFIGGRGLDVLVQTARRREIIFHSGTDAACRASVQGRFPGDSPPEDAERMSASCLLRCLGPGRQRREWKIWADGAIHFSSTITDESPPGPPAVSVSDVAEDLVFGCRAARDILRDVFGWTGRVRITVRISAAGAKLLNGSNRGMRGLALEPTSLATIQADTAQVFVWSDDIELLEPHRLVATLLAALLRDLRGAKLNLDELAASIEREIPAMKPPLPY